MNILEYTCMSDENLNLQSLSRDGGVGKLLFKFSTMWAIWILIPWAAAYQAPPSMGFSRQEYWSGVPLPSSISISNSI